MKLIAEYCVKKPITVLMSVLIISVLGVFSLSNMSLSLFPDVSMPYAVIVTTYQGANPEQVEEYVTKPIESSIQTLSNFDSIQSTSNEHYSMIMVMFNDGTNMDTAFLDMRESIDTINFPDGVDKPRIMRISVDMMPIASISISKDFGEDLTEEENLIKTTQWLEKDIMPKLEGINGVASVSVNGTADIVVSFQLDGTKLTEYGLTQDGVLNTVENSNIDGLIGVTTDTDGIKMLYIGNKIDGMEELESLPIYYDSVNSKVVTLNDLCVDGIKFENNAEDSYTKINGKLGVTISFQQETSSELTDVVDEIEKTLSQIVKEDNTVDYIYLLNQGDYVNSAVGTVIQNLIIGAVLAVIILLIFLRDIRPTAIVAISIPVSVIATFGLMYVSGVGLNVVSMGGLALGVGMLVDNSIVVIENIYRLLNEGKSKKEAAIYGAKQVATAITSSSLTTMVVFLPIMLIGGMIGDVFKAMSLTIIYSLLCSLVIALTVVPSSAAKILKNIEVKEKTDGKIYQIYDKCLVWSLAHKAIVLSAVIVFFVGFAILSFSRGFILIPSTDEGQINVTINYDERLYDENVYVGDATFDELSDIADATTALIMAIDDVETISVSMNKNGLLSSLMGGGSENAISYTILLKENRDKSTAKNTDMVEKVLKEFNYQITRGSRTYDLTIDEIDVSASDSTAATFGASGVAIYVKGNDLYELEAVANDLVAILEATDGVKKASNGIVKGNDIVKIEVNKEEAIKIGLTTSDFSKSINLFYESLGVSMVSEAPVEVEIDGVLYELNASSSSSMTSLNIPWSLFLSMINVFDGDLCDALLECEYPVYTVQATPYGMAIVVNPTLGYRVDAEGYKFIVSNDLAENDTTIVDGNVYQAVRNSVKTKVYDPINNYTSIQNKTGFQSINRDGKYRFLQVSAQFEEGANVTKVSDKINKKIDTYLASDEFKPYKNTVFVSQNGENEAIMEAVYSLLKACVIAILLVYMIMCIQFQSLKYAFIVLATVPLAFTGGFISLLITGMDMSIVAIMGLIVLVGIVVNNGIVIIDYMNQLIEAGHKVSEAVILAGKTRLRPIFMTALTTVLGLVPMALGFGEGGELLQPMAIAAIGGLLYATILTLIVVPIIYSLFNFRKIRKENEEEVVEPNVQ